MAVFRSIGARKDATRGTAPIETRKALASLFTGAGVLPGAASPLVTSTAGFAYSVGAARWVTTRGASDGVHLWGNDGALSVATGVAPGAGLSRIDVIYALHPANTENGDTTSEPVVAVAQGTAASTPLAPSIPAGALELARNTMTSAATTTASAGNTISQTAATAEVVSALPTVVYADASTAGKVGDGVVVVGSVAFPAIGRASRVIVSAEGVAGFEAAAVDVGLVFGGSATVTQRVFQFVTAAAGKWAVVTRSGYMDIPANTSGAINVASEVSGGTAYFRVGVTFTRVAV